MHPDCLRRHGRPPIQSDAVGRRASGIGLWVLLAVSMGWAQDGPQAANPSLSLEDLIRYSATGLALPQEPLKADLELAADHVTTWREGDEQALLLEKHVRVHFGAYAFRADRAVVILRPDARPGPPARQVAIYLDQAAEINGQGVIGHSAPRLMVTAVLVGRVELETNFLERQIAETDPLVISARDRLNRYRAALAERLIPIDAKRVASVDAVPPPELDPDGTPKPRRTFLPAQVDFGAGRVVYRTAKEDREPHVQLLGGLRVLYTDSVTNRSMVLTADRGVIFTADGDVAEGSTQASKVRGIYLEDNVLITDGQYTLRGPRVYYDLNTDRAVILEAVFFTWDASRQVPLYVRAEKLQRRSVTSWSAEQAQLTTSEFREPHVAVGVSRLTIEQQDQPEGPSRHWVQAEGVTLNVGGSPVLPFGNFQGTASDLPLRKIRVGDGSRRGFTTETDWDLFALLNEDKPKGVDATLSLDEYANRGPGVGLFVKYDRSTAIGELDAYYQYDDNQDEPGGRLEVDPPSNHRGRILFNHKQQLTDDWELQAEASWVSDPNYIDEWFKSDAFSGKEYQTLIYLKQQREDWAFGFLAQFDPLEFSPQIGLSQTRGNILAPGDASVSYAVQKLPELSYWQVGTPIFGDQLTWFSENRASVLRANLPEDSPADRGFNAAQSLAAFGIAAPATSFDSALRTAGIDQQTRVRFDSRQEVQAPMQIGDISVTPYATGRLTAYDDDFSEYRGETDSTRLWGAAGVKFHTAFSRTDDAVHSDLLDLHRMRHIVEPSVNVFYAASDVNQESWVVYDYDVESLAEGFATRLGLRNTWQTQRGGEGHWRSVEWLRVDTDVVLTGSETAIESPIARFFDYRPELGIWGDHFWGEAALQATDTLSFLGNLTYGFDSERVERWELGASLEHNPHLGTFLAWRGVEALDSSVFQYGIEYRLTPKYFLTLTQSWDINLGENRLFAVTVTRRLPHWLLNIDFSFDAIEDDTTVGFSLTPEGLGGQGRPSRNPFVRDQVTVSRY